MAAATNNGQSCSMAVSTILTRQNQGDVSKNLLINVITQIKCTLCKPDIQVFIDIYIVVV